MKLPQYVVQGIWYRIGIDAKPIRTSSVFLHAGKCPMCEDYKHRMYLREYPDFYNVKCHNCGYNTSIESFLKDEYPTEYDSLKEYFIDAIRTRELFKKPLAIPKETKSQNEIEMTDMRLRTYLKQNGFRVVRPQKDHKKEILRQRVLEYLEGRKLPKTIYSDFWVMMDGFLRGYIGIPFYNETKTHMIHVQGRLYAGLGRSDPQKYLFLKDLDSDIVIELPGKEIWGQWRVNKEDTVIICEGTLDAAAFEKGVATCGATIGDSFIRDIKRKYPNRIWAVDNFWNDKEGRKLTEKLLLMGESCFILPNNPNIKDSNDLIKTLVCEYITEDMIDKWTYSGKLGLAKLRLKNVI